MLVCEHISSVPQVVDESIFATKILIQGLEAIASKLGSASKPSTHWQALINFKEYENSTCNVTWSASRYYGRQ
jgi:hypothetical protein